MTRRRFLARVIALGGVLGAVITELPRAAAAAGRRILGKQTPATALFEENPAQLDIRHLEITPPGEMGVMGQRTNPAGLAHWRLSVEGEVERPLGLSYEDVLALPSVERAILLVCPGTFSFLAAWKGVGLQELLTRAGPRPEARYVEFRNRPDIYSGRVESFTLEEAKSGRLMLAYALNGRPLPEEHGFPLRLVAEDHYGNVWVKYVVSVRVVG